MQQFALVNPSRKWTPRTQNTLPWHVRTQPEMKWSYTTSNKPGRVGNLLDSTTLTNEATKAHIKHKKFYASAFCAAFFVMSASPICGLRNNVATMNAEAKK